MRRTRNLTTVGAFLALLISSAGVVNCAGDAATGSPENEVASRPERLWQDLGCCATSGVAASSWSSTRVDEWVNTSGNSIWHRACTAAPCSTSTWGAWESGPGAPPGGAVGRPAAVSMSNGRVDLFVRGLADNNIWQRTWTSSGWSSWQTLGGALRSAPSASSWDSQSLDVWATGSDGRIWHRPCRNLTNGCTGDAAFGAWEPNADAPPPGVHSTNGDPATVSWGPNRVDLFVTGADSQLYHRAFSTSGWSGWEALGGALGSSPAVATWGVNRLDVYSRGQDGSAWHKAWQENNSWTSWESLNRGINSAPAAISRGLRTMHVFAIDQNSDLWEDQCNGEFDCRGVTLGSVHTPAFQFAPDSAFASRSEWEVTALALPPTQSGCNNQARVLYSSGGAPESSAILRAAVSCAGSAGCASQSSVNLAGLPITRSVGSNDNQLVRGPDGHAIFMKQIFENSGGTEHVSEFAWKSTDCGATFSYLGKVNSASIPCGNGHTYGENQFPGVPGGFDRFEVYNDPWTSTLYLTANLRGPASCATPSATMLFSSTDGASWVKRQTLAFDSTPATMTTNPSGNLYVVQCEAAGNAKVQQFKNSAQTVGSVVTLSGIGCAWPSRPNTTNFGDSGGLYVSRVGTYADATDPSGFDVVRLFIPVLNPAGYNELKVFKVEFRATPVWAQVGTISPRSGFSMRHPVLLEPDLIGKTADRSNAAVVYWRELALSSGANSETIRYATIRDVNSISITRDLSLSSSGATVSWDWASDTGVRDYTKGASYWDGNAFRFFGQWTRNVGGNMQVFMNWVSLED